ncbi:GntR family transcriptional regulator [Roseimarinus sediminis]|uniref:GntR family transcriptional regulator n=1 Tax=Roseimarinus sediminis TaxID=1610899 RepID=UPI003D253D68
MSTSDLPLHKLIYEQLRRQISDGTFAEGTLLPSEHQLCSLYQSTRPTIRKALDRLTSEGYIKKQQGKGSIVKGVPSGIGILSFSGTTSAIGQEKLTTRIISGPEIRAWEKAFSFKISEKEKAVGCYYLERLRLVNNLPVFFDITMVPNINLPRFSQRSFENKSLFDILRKNYQLEVKGGEQKLQAIKADERLQHHFKVNADHPVLQLDRKMETNRIDFYLYSQVFCNTESYTLYGTF